VLLAEDLADPDMCGHLWPGADPGAPGAPGAFGDGLAAVEEDVPDRAGVEEVEALATLSPSARLAPRAAPPTAVAARGLLILTRFSFLVLAPGHGGPGAGRVTRFPSWPSRPGVILCGLSQSALNDTAWAEALHAAAVQAAEPAPRPRPARMGG